MKRSIISTSRLAEICGVSQGTVDRALNNRKGINPETKEKILQKAREYGYRPNIHARSIAGGKSMLIGIIVFDLYNQYFSDIVTSLEAECAKKGYSAVIMFSNKEPQKEIECIKSMYHMSLDGIVLCPINTGAEFESFLLSLEIPIVTIGNRLQHFTYAGIDNAAAMREAVELVLKKGYKKLIYVMPRQSGNNFTGQYERLYAFEEICRENGTDYTVTDIETAQSGALAQQGGAFICPTDLYAVMLYNQAQKHGMGIIGFDNIRIIDELGLKLNSVAYSHEQAALWAVEYITDSKPIPESVAYKIIDRGSV